jgi:hypothetical protein
MFKCQFSGESSSPAVYRSETVVVRNEDGKETERTIRRFVSAPEKALKVVVVTRSREYNNTIWNDEDERRDFVTHGTEIVKELTIRARHLAAVKVAYGLT